MSLTLIRYLLNPKEGKAGKNMFFLRYKVNSFILLIETEERNDKTNLFALSIIPTSEILSTKSLFMAS